MTPEQLLQMKLALAPYKFRLTQLLCEYGHSDRALEYAVALKHLPGAVHYAKHNQSAVNRSDGAKGNIPPSGSATNTPAPVPTTSSPCVGAISAQDMDILLDRLDKNLGGLFAWLFVDVCNFDLKCRSSGG